MAHWQSKGYHFGTVIDDILDQSTKNEKESNIGLFMKGIECSEWQTLRHSALDWHQMECGTENASNVTKCAHNDSLIVNLKRFKDSKYIINAMNMNRFNVSHVICDFDQLVSVHHIISVEDAVIIQQCIANQIVPEL